MPAAKHETNMDKGATAMDDNLLSRLENYLKEYYEEPFQGYYQISSGHRKEDGKNKAPAIQSEYYQLELNLPSLKKSFATKLLELIRAKGKTEIEIYKKANIDRRLFSKIRTNADYAPSKATILALIFALELEIDEAEDLLERAGYCLSRSKKEDVVIQFFIENQIYDLFTIQKALEHFGLPVLGG